MADETPAKFDATRVVDRIAQVVWMECCPGVRLTHEDVAHYRRLACVILAVMDAPA